MPKNSTKTDANDRGRFSAGRKTDAVLRLLRDEDLDTLSRELGVVATAMMSRAAPEPLRLPRHRQAVRPPAGLPHLRPGPLHRLFPQGPRRRAARVAAGAPQARPGRGGS
jgi:hypothetical protein